MTKPQSNSNENQSSFPSNSLIGATFWMALPPAILAICLIGIRVGDLTMTLAVAISTYGLVAELIACIFIAGVDWELNKCRRAFENCSGSLREVRRNSASVLKLNHSRSEEPIVFKFVRGLEAAHRQGIDRSCIPALIQALVGELDVWCDRIRGWSRMLPTLGLLGTVLGIIVLSSEIGAAAADQDSDVVGAIRGALAGMSTALVTTFTASLFGAIALSGLANHASTLIIRLRDELEALSWLIDFGEDWGNDQSTTN